MKGRELKGPRVHLEPEGRSVDQGNTTNGSDNSEMCGVS